MQRHEADCFAVSQQRRTDDCAESDQSRSLVIGEVRISKNIGDLQCALGNRNAAHQSPGVGRAAMFGDAFAPFRLEPEGCGQRVAITVTAPEYGLTRPAQARSRLDERVQNFLQIERRAADRFQNLSRRGLPLKGLLQLLRARLLGLEQARVLDGDHGLPRERL